MSVIGLDVVTADGDELYIDAEHHPDLYWAARGSGPGFFAVVTAFHLKLYPKSPILASSFYAYPMEYADEIYSWAREITADVDRRVEVQIVASKTVPNAGIDRPAIVLASPVFADTEDEARRRSPFWTAVPSSTRRWWPCRMCRWDCRTGTPR